MSDNKNRAAKAAAEAGNDTAAAEAAKAELEATVAEAGADDPRDAVIADLERQLAELNNPREMDAKDRAIEALRQQLREKTATPEGEAEELRKAVAALEEQVKRMQEGVGLVPVPESDGLDPYLYGMVLATGEVLEVQHPHATNHLSPQHNMVVPVISYFTLAPEHAEQATKAARDKAKAEAAAAGRRRR